MAARLLIIALDGADSGMVDRGSANHSLPALAALRGRGRAHWLQAPPGLTDDALWASFQFGAPVGEHGRYHYLQRLSRGRFGMAHLEEGPQRFFWEPLSDAGQAIAVFDLPKTGAPRPLNGVHLCDWLVHGRYFPRPVSWPAELATDVVQRFGEAPHSDCDHPVAMDDAAVRSLVTRLGQSADMKSAAASALLQTRAWDLFMVGFKEAHCAGHALWDLEDADHGAHDAARNRRLGQPMQAVLRQLDRSIATLVDAAGPDAAVLVLCTTGMQPNASLDHFHTPLARRMASYLNGRGPLRWLGRPQAQVEFLPYNENASAVGLPGADAAHVDRASKVFEALRDADTGACLVEGIEQPRRDWHGRRAERLPDLLVRYRPGCIPKAIHSPQLGRIEAAVPRFRPGNHRSGPMLIAAGIEAEAAAAMEDLGPLAARYLQH